MRNTLARFGLVAIGAVILLGACGGGEGDGASTASVSSTAASAAHARLLPPVQYRAYLAEHPDVPVVNVHVPYEGHIEGTDAFVPYTEITAWADLPADKDAPIALYCRSGRMSGEAAAALASLGYTDIVDLDGGMVAWEAAGLALLDEPPA